MIDDKLSGRAKRMEHLKGLNKRAGLNLVSLMDIFTILVFFLLVTSDSQKLPSTKDITLPTSVAKKVPRETVVLSITKKELFIQGKQIVSLTQLSENQSTIIKELLDELKYQASKSLFSSSDKSVGRAITIMGDEHIPYKLLRKILATCRQANYTRIAFAAYQKASS
ncbi:MAG: biopolymer transporter ExbD [Thioalkalispiraceae bacterium]|jgi:biopolymer transport protein ExbD